MAEVLEQAFHAFLNHLIVIFLTSTIILIVLLILPGFFPKFYIYILAVIFVTALLAMSLNLLVGYGGLFQFHHAAFYGVGAYTIALVLTKTSLPFWFGSMAGPIMAAAVGLLIGMFCVRLTKQYFGMLQILLGSLIWAIAFRWYGLTGGDGRDGENDNQWEGADC